MRITHSKCYGELKDSLPAAEPRAVVASEIGGIAFTSGKAPRGGWGYAGVADTPTEQEINGLLTA